MGLITSNIYAELVKFRGNTVKCADGPSEIIKYLTEQGFIRVCENTILPDLTICPVAWEITVAGETALSEFEEMRRKETEDKRQQRFDNKISVLNILIPLVTFILGLLVEHFAGIAAWLLSFF